MNGTRTLKRQMEYPKEKNPFHEDAAKSKNGIKRTFSILKESLRRSFRKKPEPPVKYNSISRPNELYKPQRTEPEEEFVIRTKIPDRCAPTMPPSRHTVATTSGATATPVPPPRISSMRKRNRLNSTSSGGSTNPFEDDVIPLFPDTIAASRHTLNIPQLNKYGSQSTLRTSCDSISTIGRARRKKRDAPPPPPPPPPPDAEEAATSVTHDVVTELQKIRCDIALMTEDLNQDCTFRDGDDEIITKDGVKLDETVATTHVEALCSSCDIIQKDDEATVESSDELIESAALETRIPLQLEDAAAKDISTEYIEYVTSETIVLKRSISHRESVDNRIPTPPIELTTFQPIQDASVSDVDEPNRSLVSKDDSNENEQTAKVDEVDCRANSNEMRGVTWETLQCDKAHIKYIDDDRDDLLEYPDVIERLGSY